MKRPYRYPFPAVGCLPILLMIAACGQDNSPQDVAGGPCPGESGFGARLEGPEEPVDVCVADDSVVTVFTYQGWYDVQARMTDTDGTVYRFSMMFPHHSTSRKLNLTGNLAEARADANGAWFRLMIAPVDGPPTESTAVTSGTFRLGYSDTEVVAGLFENVALEMSIAGRDGVVGTRKVPRGFFSILTDIDESSASR